jgi:hypothetical protein
VAEFFGKDWNDLAREIELPSELVDSSNEHELVGVNIIDSFS